LDWAEATALGELVEVVEVVELGALDARWLAKMDPSLLNIV
jgi:hypothetical protein